MSHVYEGPLATYNSLTDKNLSSYFSNTRMRKHLRKAGLVSRRGMIVSENQYRLNMARREHKKHVKDLLAQAIVHKSLDLERTRQVEIKNKLEEIAKIELVRRVRNSEKKANDDILLPLLSPRSAKRKRKPPKLRLKFDDEGEEEEEIESALNPPKNVSSENRKGDEEVLPYLSPRLRRKSGRSRPQSAPNANGHEDVIYVDEDGRPLTPTTREMVEEAHRRPQSSKEKSEQIDSRHLYALDSAALKKYALTLSKIEQGEGLVSPYSINQIPTPPRSARSGSRFSQSGGRLRQRPRTADSRTTSERRTPLQLRSRLILDAYKSRYMLPRSYKPMYSQLIRNVSQGSLMLHRQEPAVMHQGEVQTLCEITMKYHGPNLTLPRDQYDPCQSIAIDQQHCGGNTLTVFREKLKAGDTFTFISRRHRGYPFSLSVYVEGRIDFRISRCCEYKHFSGVRLGGKLGHFSLMKVTGATPCYRCALNAQATPRSLKRPVPVRQVEKAEEIREEVITTGSKKQERKQVDEDEKAIEIHVEGSEATPQQDKIFDNLHPDEKEADDYEDDFDNEDDDNKKDSAGKYDDDFESSKSSSSSSSSSSDEDEAPPKKTHEIKGFAADEDDKVKEKPPKGRGLDNKRTVQGYSSEEEYLENPSKFESPYKKKEDLRHKSRGGRDSDSSRSRSRSSSTSSVERSTEKKEEKQGKTVVRRASLSSNSDSDTEVKKSKRRSSSSSASSSSSYSKSTPKEKVIDKKEDVMDEVVTANEGMLEAESDEVASSRSITPPPQRRESPSPVLKREIRSPSPEEVQKKEPDLKTEVLLEPDFKEVEIIEDEKDAIFVEKSYKLEQDKPEAEIPEKATYRKMYETDDRQETAARAPERGMSSKIYEDKPVETRSQEQKAAAPLSVPQRKEEPKKAAESVVSTSVDSSDSSSDEDTVTDTERTKRNIDIQAARKRADSISSSSSSSDSETESEKPKQETKPEVTVSRSPQKLDRKSLSTSTGSTTSSGESSDSETETDIEKSKSTVTPAVTHVEKSTAQPDVKPVAETTQPATEVKAVAQTSQPEPEVKAVAQISQPETEVKRSLSPPKEEEKKKPVSDTGSSSSDSSSSDSETETATETDTDRKPPATQTAKPPSPIPTAVIETKLDTSQNKPAEVVKTKPVSETEDSSDSSSSSDSETETETDRTTERKASPSPLTPAPPAPPKEPVAEPEKSSSPVAPAAEAVTSDKKAADVNKTKSDTETADSDSSSDSDSDTSSSDSDSDTDKEKPPPTQAAPEKKTEFNLTDSDAPHIQSESDGEKLKYNVFGSDSGTDHMHGGNDPDNVAAGTVKSSYDAKIGTKPGQPLEGSILHKIEGQSDIDLSSIALTSNQVDELIRYLTKAFNVETLSLRNCGIADDDFDRLVDALIDSKSKLKILNFNLNKLGFKSADEITDILEDQPEVETLLLHGNPLKDQGVKVLLHGLLDLTEEIEKGKTTCLKELDLGDTQMGDEGMVHVSKFLEKNKTLETLNLNGNKSITEVGWKRLGKALKKNETLKTLSLDYNTISLDGLRALVAGLKDNTTLRTLEMEDTGITKEGGKLIRDLVKCNTSILEISTFPGNDIPEPTREDIRRYLALNNASTKKS